MRKMRKYFRRLVSDKESVRICSGYSFAMSQVKAYLDSEPDQNKQIRYLDFVISIIGEDLKTSVMTTILYKEAFFEENLPALLLPTDYYDKLGVRHSIAVDATLIDIELDRSCVLTLPWKREKFTNIIARILEEGFQMSKSRHAAYHFSTMDVTIVWEGHHSIAVGVGIKEGVIRAEKLEIEQLYDHIYTDGFYWMNAHTNEKYALKVFDFRFALLYELSKLRFRLLKN